MSFEMSRNAAPKAVAAPHNNVTSPGTEEFEMNERENDARRWQADFCSGPTRFGVVRRISRRLHVDKGP